MLCQVNSLQLSQFREYPPVLLRIEWMALLKTKEGHVVSRMEDDRQPLFRSLDNIAGALMILSECAIFEEERLKTHKQFCDHWIQNVTDDSRNPFGILLGCTLLGDSDGSV